MSDFDDISSRVIMKYKELLRGLQDYDEGITVFYDLPRQCPYCGGMLKLVSIERGIGTANEVYEYYKCRKCGRIIKVRVR